MVLTRVVYLYTFTLYFDLSIRFTWKTFQSTAIYYFRKWVCPNLALPSAKISITEFRGFCDVLLTFSVLYSDLDCNVLLHCIVSSFVGRVPVISHLKFVFLLCCLLFEPLHGLLVSSSPSLLASSTFHSDHHDSIQYFGCWDSDISCAVPMSSFCLKFQVYQT